MKKTVAIALSTYNGAQYIREQLESLVHQTILEEQHYQVKLVVRDDGSTDATLSILKEYQRTYPALQWTILEGENIGWKQSFNELLQATVADYIFLCDQDDIWDLDKCRIMLDQMQRQSEIEVLIHRVQYYYTSDVGVKKILNQSYEELGITKNDGSLEQVPPKAHFSYFPFLGCCFLITNPIREEYLSVIHHKENTIAHDTALFLIGATRNSLFYLNRQLIQYRQHSQNATSVSNRQNPFQLARKQKRTTLTFYENLMVILSSIASLSVNRQQAEDAQAMLDRIRKEYLALKHHRMLRFTRLKRGKFGWNKLMLIDMLVALVPPIRG
ncbi:glycosyltransferase [Streptococcus sp. DD13]|uniref:glycosyltransferase n=1 Tax=Streptococcus sp. DD13 TaxID=1777881 RepID=UPI000797595D|nr:glycosyltransferase [Streptococcus sp. DD13]KXT79145.1 Alpha-L-Rha alpha-1,3-L-rhamnosyltransferase [Streptococcus sp. DD13]